MRKRTGKLYSVFSGLITQYIEYKQNIGCKTTVMECLLKRFDKLANDRNEKVLGISKDLADAWCCRFPGESEDNRYYGLSFFEDSLLSCKQSDMIHIFQYCPNINQILSPTFTHLTKWKESSRSATE